MNGGRCGIGLGPKVPNSLASNAHQPFNQRRWCCWGIWTSPSWHRHVEDWLKIGCPLVPSVTNIRTVLEKRGTFVGRAPFNFSLWQSVYMLATNRTISNMEQILHTDMKWITAMLWATCYSIFPFLRGRWGEQRNVRTSVCFLRLDTSRSQCDGNFEPYYAWIITITIRAELWWAAPQWPCYHSRGRTIWSCHSVLISAQ